MKDNVSISLRTTEERANILTQIAADQDRSRNHLINQALDNYIEMQNEWISGIEAAQKQVREGKTIPMKEVFDRLGV